MPSRSWVRVAVLVLCAYAGGVVGVVTFKGDGFRPHMLSPLQVLAAPVAGVGSLVFDAILLCAIGLAVVYVVRRLPLWVGIGFGALWGIMDYLVLRGWSTP